MNTAKFQACDHCDGCGKILLDIGRRARRRYARMLEQFERGYISQKPKELTPHIDICQHCAGTGLQESESFPNLQPHYPHVAIVGGGIGGAALAVACQHRGIPYTLYERDASFNARSQGYGLTLQQASKAMAGLGIMQLENGIISTKHVVHNSAGKVIGKWGRRYLSAAELQKFTKPRNVHISRQELRAILLGQLQDQSSISWGSKCVAISAGKPGSKLQIEFEQSGKLRIDQADLVVGADGIRSSVRRLSLGEDIAPLRYLGCIVILGICPLSELSGSPLLDGATVFQSVNGHDRIYMMPYDREHIMWQLSFPVDLSAALSLSQLGPAALKREGLRRLGDWHAPIPEILTATDISRITGYPVYDRPVLSPADLTDLGNITLLGDAMHPMSPFKGQGANQAILDALDLARALGSKCGPDSLWRERGLRELVLTDFEEQMLQRSALKVGDSARAVELLHSETVLHEGDLPRGRRIDPLKI